MKVLIVSHNPINQYTNTGKTLMSLFSSFQKEELCQLFFNPFAPEKGKCSSYFRITDKDVFNRFFKRQKSCGRIIKEIENYSGNWNGKFNTANKLSDIHEFKRIARDILWKKTRWFSSELAQWLKEEKPTVIFAVVGDGKFIYDIALSIAKTVNIPVVPYICDDYYFLHNISGFWNRIKFKLLRKKIDFFMKYIETAIFICEEMRLVYEEKFNIYGHTIMTGISKISDIPRDTTTLKVFSYMGNVSCGRYVSLIDIGKVLRKLNAENSSNQYELRIFTNENNPRILKKLISIDTIKLCGFIVGEEYKKAVDSSSVLIHTESFEKNFSELVKYSISTKIPELLGNGKPIIAYAPANVASMLHFMRNNAAFSASSMSQLECVINECLNNQEKRQWIIKNAIKTANCFHNSEKNSSSLKEVLQKIKDNE